MASFSDDFNRADGSLGSNWTQAPTFGALAIISNQVRANVVGRCVMHVATATATFSADQEVTATLSTVSASDPLGLAVRVDPTTGTGYYFFVDTNPRSLQKYDGTTFTDLNTIGERFSATSGDVFTLRVVGTTIDVIKNGTTILSKTDATYSSGQPAITYNWGNNRSSRLDNASAQDVASGPSPAAIAYYRRVCGIAPER